MSRVFILLILSAVFGCESEREPTTDQEMCMAALDAEVPEGSACSWSGRCWDERIYCPGPGNTTYDCVDGSILVYRGGCPDAGPEGGVQGLSDAF